MRLVADRLGRPARGRLQVFPRRPDLPSSPGRFRWASLVARWWGRHCQQRPIPFRQATRDGRISPLAAPPFGLGFCLARPPVGVGWPGEEPNPLEVVEATRHRGHVRWCCGGDRAAVRGSATPTTPPVPMSLSVCPRALLLLFRLHGNSLQGRRSKTRWLSILHGCHPGCPNHQGDACRMWWWDRGFHQPPPTTDAVELPCPRMSARSASACWGKCHPPRMFSAGGLIGGYCQAILVGQPGPVPMAGIKLLWSMAPRMPT